MGEPQLIIQTLLCRTNLLMAGKRVAITDTVPGLAERLRAMGAHPGAPLGLADIVIGDADPALLKPGAILAKPYPGREGERLREGVVRAPGHEVYIVDLSC